MPYQQTATELKKKNFLLFPKSALYNYLVYYERLSPPPEISGTYQLSEKKNMHSVFVSGLLFFYELLIQSDKTKFAIL